MLLDMILHKLGLVRAKHANRWAYQAACFRAKLTEIHHRTPHDTIKREIEDVFSEADNTYLR